MNALQILLVTMLVLRSGDRIPLDEAPREENGVTYFRSAGVLYSLPTREIARIGEDEPEKPKEEPVRRLRVSEEERRRLIAELEKNHSGIPAKPLEPVAAPPSPAPPPAARSDRDEWSWRREARAHEEAIRQAHEEVQLLEEKISRLRGEIITFTNLGYSPRQFTWQTTQLVYAEEQLPAARLAITRAERAYAQFKEDARKQGVLPGWLR